MGDQMPKDLKLAIREDGKTNQYSTEELFGGRTHHPIVEEKKDRGEMEGQAGQKHRSMTHAFPGLLTRSEYHLAAGKKSVIFAVPGAFTPTCSEQHLPSFVGLREVTKRLPHIPFKP